MNSARSARASRVTVRHARWKRLSLRPSPRLSFAGMYFSDAPGPRRVHRPVRELVALDGDAERALCRGAVRVGASRLAAVPGPAERTRGTLGLARIRLDRAARLFQDRGDPMLGRRVPRHRRGRRSAAPRTDARTVPRAVDPAPAPAAPSVNATAASTMRASAVQLACLPFTMSPFLLGRPPLTPVQ